MRPPRELPFISKPTTRFPAAAFATRKSPAATQPVNIGSPISPPAPTGSSAPPTWTHRMDHSRPAMSGSSVSTNRARPNKTWNSPTSAECCDGGQPIPGFEVPSGPLSAGVFLTRECFRPRLHHYAAKSRILAQRVHLGVDVENRQRRRPFFAGALQFTECLIPLPKCVSQHRHVIGIDIFGRPNLFQSRADRFRFRPPPAPHQARAFQRLQPGQIRTNDFRVPVLR